jgi:hypothetical protein
LFQRTANTIFLAQLLGIFFPIIYPFIAIVVVVNSVYLKTIGALANKLFAIEVLATRKRRVRIARGCWLNISKRLWCSNRDLYLI